jgi:peptidoglycan/LPS O-acetylase OafA/YrhL
MKKSRNEVYFPNLNGVRFIAALSVLIYHFFDTHILNGHLGVILFFVLSGFLITYLLLAEKENNKSINVKKFYIRRILRIWPLYFLIVLIASIVFFVIKSPESGHLQFHSLLMYYVFLIPNVAFVLDIGLNYAGILWSVGSEEQYYLVWPWLIRVKRKQRIFIILISIIIFFSLMPHVIDYINNHFFNNSKNILYYSSRVMLRMSFNSMATGGLLAFLYRYKRDYINFLFNKVFQFICFTALLSCWIFNVEFLFNDQFYATLFGILILNLAVNPKVIFSLENKVFDYLGKISYGLYVYHMIAFSINAYIITHWLKLPFSNNIYYFFAGILTTVIISSLSYYFFEKPFLKIKFSRFSLIKSGDLLSKKESAV